MSDYLSRVYELIEKHRRQGVLIDTNLLILLLVGRFDSSQITNFSNTSRYSADDHALMEAFVENFDRIITTPTILAETNSLANQLGKHLRPAFYTSFAMQLILPQPQIPPQFAEIYLPSAEIAELPAIAELIQFGLTDTGIIRLSKSENYLVLTDDLKLSVQLESRGIDALNFNHLRDY
ncbi:MAG: hypothetical protein H7175_11520 [Burkholderiales bacterium]|nr:hypothetical protein [Anaerolineae bacterium]